MQVEIISESAFNQLEPFRQVIIHDYAHRYGLLDLGEKLGVYGLSWRSQRVKPIVEVSSVQNRIWLGVEQGLTAIERKTGRLILVMPLTSDLIQILLLGELTAVLTEDEMLLFNLNGSVRLSQGLPDLPEEIAYSGENLEIRLMEGSSISLNPETGAISYPEYA